MSTLLAVKKRVKFKFGPIQLRSTSNVHCCDSDLESKVSASDPKIPLPTTPRTPINVTIPRPHLKKIFNKFDHTKTGTLNLCEFSSTCYCIIGNKKLSNIDIIQIFNTIDNNSDNEISFDEFCEFIEPTNNVFSYKNHKHISEVFANAVEVSKPTFFRYSSATPPPSKFEDDYISVFWARDLGASIIAGNNGMNAYVKWRFTEHARNNISYGSKILSINNKKVNGLLFDEIVDFLNIVIITTEGFQVKFRPATLLHEDRYYPTDFRTFRDDNIKDCELLKPQFDKKKQRSRSLRKLILTHKQLDLSKLSEDSMMTISQQSEISPSLIINYDTNNGNIQPVSQTSMYEDIENCKIPNWWYKFPKILLIILCIPNINSVSKFKQYGSHCRHCPKRKHKCRLIMHNILDNEKYSKLSYFIQVVIMSMILISTMSYIIETLPVFNNNIHATKVFNWIESIVSIIFTLEYLLRIIASRNICVFFWDGLNLIDFVAIIPFWIEIISGAKGSNALRVIRVIRLARVFRLMKSPRFAEYMLILQRTLVNSMGSFGLFLTLIFLEIIIASSLVYVCEQTQPNTNFTSIPATSWWAFTTVTTIGYGDMVPQSVLGRIICVFTLFSGLLVIALPVIIIGGNFSDEYTKYVQRKAGWNASNFGEEYKTKKQQIFTVARLLHFINHKQCKDIFEWQDVKYLCDEGLDSFEIINRILTFEHGHCYLPKEFSSYKKYALFEFYGEKLRRNKNNINPYLGVRKNQRTQSQPPPNTNNKWAKDIAGFINKKNKMNRISTANDEKFEETDTLLT